jgi:hypothetical protein
MSCKHFRTEIEETDRATALGAKAAAHIAVCGSCRAFRAERDSLRSLIGGLERVDAPSDFDFRLRARIARAEEAKDTRFARHSFVPGAAWLAVATCAVLALAGLVVFRQAQRQMPSSQPSDATANSVAVKTPPQTNSTVTSAHEPQEAAVESSDNPVNDVRPVSRVQRSAPRRYKFVLSRDAVEQIAATQPSAGSLETNNLSVQGTKIYVGSPIPLPVTTPDRPLEALFKDVHGASRVVSVDPVTFGARGLPSHRVSTRNVVYSQGVW